MKVIIEIERDEELEKIGKVLKGESITVVKTKRGREEILENIFWRRWLSEAQPRKR